MVTAPMLPACLGDAKCMGLPLQSALRGLKHMSSWLAGTEFHACARNLKP